MEERGMIPLCLLPIGKKAKVIEINSKGTTRRRLLDLGLIVDTTVEAVQKSPVGDLKAYFIRGAVIAIRPDQANQIIVKPEIEDSSRF